MTLDFKYAGKRCLPGATLISTIVAIFLWPCVLLADAPAKDLDSIAKAVDARYNHLRTLQADFVETYAGAGAERCESGTLLLKKPGKMRWEYRSPKVKVFVSDGKQAWFVIPEEKQARKIAAHQLNDLRSPLAFLLGNSRLRKEVKGLSFANDIRPLVAEDVVLRGVPVGMEDRLTEIVLEITPDYQIARISLEGTDGSDTEYRFSNQKDNPPVPDQEFRFVPPPGFETIEGDFTQ